MTRSTTTMLAATVLAAFAVFGTAGSASAKDLCLTDQFDNIFVFHNVKALKKPGKGSALNGYYNPDGTPWPIVGTATVKSDGTVVAAATILRRYPAVSVTQYISWDGNAALEGTGAYDNTLDGSADGPLILKAADCKAITIP